MLRTGSVFCHIANYRLFIVRYEYFNKGVDLFIEALARLNFFLKVVFAHNVAQLKDIF